MPPLARLGAQDPREGGQTIQLKLRLIEETGTLLLSGGQEPPESWGGDGCWGGKVLSLSQRLHLPSLSGKAQPPAARTSFPRESPSPTQQPENVYRGHPRLHKNLQPCFVDLCHRLGPRALVILVTLMATLTGPFPRALSGPAEDAAAGVCATAGCGRRVLS